MESKSKLHIPLRIRLRFMTRNWIWLFWLVLLPIVWILLPLERLTNPIAGLVTAETENVGALETVRIRALDVTVGQHIKAGDVLAEVEGFAEQKDKLNALDYSVKGLNVQQNAQQQEQNLFSLEIRTQQLMEDTRVALAAKQMEQARDKATLDGLYQELKHLEPMVQQGLITDLELTRIRPQITALEKTLASYPAFINTLTARLASAQAELNQIEQYKQSQQSAFSGIQGDTLAAISGTVSSLEEGKVSYIFAKTEGVVSRIQYTVGDIVPSGTPIIRTTSTHIKVMGLLRQYQVELVHEGMTLSVVPLNRTPYRKYSANVVSVEPEILDLADPFVSMSRNRFPTRGRRMILELHDENHDLIPGESVTIFLPPPTFRQKMNQLIGQLKWKIDEKKTLWK